MRLPSIHVKIQLYMIFSNTLEKKQQGMLKTISTMFFYLKKKITWFYEKIKIKRSINLRKKYNIEKKKRKGMEKL